MKSILISLGTKQKKIQVPEKAWNVLAVYKVFWPPETVVQLGKNKLIKIENINPWPPPEQATLIDVPVVEKKREQNMN